MPSKFGGVPVQGSKFGGVPVDQEPETPGVPNPVQANPAKYTPQRLLTGAQEPVPTAGAEIARNLPRSVGRYAMNTLSSFGPQGQPSDPRTADLNPMHSVGPMLANAKHTFQHPIEALARDPIEAASTLSAPVQAASGAYALSKLLPSTERAGEKFQELNRNIGTEPVNTGHFQQPLLDARHQFDVTRDPYPPVMRNALDRLTEPGQRPLSFADSRLLASAAGKKAMRESVKPNVLQGPMVKHSADFAEGLNRANEETADRAGMGDTYRDAIDEYGRAAGMKDAAKKVATVGLMGGAGYAGKRYLLDKFLGP